MNEKAWLSATRPWLLLNFLGERVTSRKSRLLATACVRRLWSVLIDPRSRRAVEVAEQYAEGLCSEEELREAHAAASQVRCNETLAHSYAATAAMEAARLPLPGNAEGWARSAAGLRSERVIQSSLIRDLMGNPFRSVSSGSIQLTSTVRGVAQAAYEERLMPAGTLDPDRLAILADALEDAGCTDETILGHCRIPNDHVRGCWCVDALLGFS